MPVDFTKGAEKENLELTTNGDIRLVKTIGQPDAKSGRNSVKGESDSAEKENLELTTDGDIHLVKTIGQPDAKSGRNSVKGESDSDIDNTRSERMPVDFTKGAEKDNLELSTDGDIPLVKTIGQPDAKSGRNSVKGESDSAENKTLELTTNGDIPKVKTIGQPDAKSVKNSAKGESVSEFTDLERTGLTSGDLVHEGKMGI
ncbi:uncharacterized protein [Ptychodera flava]|uniref:uncharacterized protein n=1 Tax=Ptychodera flava TaxID=63121 RepID=UPI00396A268C